MDALFVIVGKAKLKTEMRRWRIMKNIFFVVLVGFLFSSCRKEPEKPFAFEMEYPVDFTINAGIGPYVTHYFDVQYIPTYVDSLFAFYDFDKANVENILPRTGKLVAVFDNVDYDFIQSIEVELYDQVNGSIKRLPAYYREPVPAKVGSLVELVSEEIDLQELLLKERFNVRIKLKLFIPAPKTVESRLILKFAVR